MLPGSRAPVSPYPDQRELGCSIIVCADFDLKDNDYYVQYTSKILYIEMPFENRFCNQRVKDSAQNAIMQ